MRTKWLVALALIAALVFVFACAGEDGDDGKDGEDGEDGLDGDDDSGDDDDDDSGDDDDDDDSGDDLVADAGDDLGDVGFEADIDLDGSGSRNATSYAWVQTGGPEVTLTGADTATPSFTTGSLDETIEVALDEFDVLGIPAENQGMYTFMLTVSDGETTATDSVTVTSIGTRRSGNANVGLDTTVYLNGGETSGGSAITAWDWTITYPDDTTEALEGRIASFVADQEGIYDVSVDLTTPDKATESKSMMLTAGEYKGAGIAPDYDNCMGCHDGSPQEPYFDAWAETDHATMFSRGLDGMVSDHYGPSCLECHTVGYDLYAASNGFDDVADATGWEFPAVLAPGTFDQMAEDYPELAGLGNIQCESCHGPLKKHTQTANAAYVGVAYDAENCGACHEGDHHPQYPEWVTGAHSGGPATTSGSCAPCHTAQGASGGSNPDEGVKGITCVACHEPHGNGNPLQLRNYGEITLVNGSTIDIGVAASCVNCHKGRRDLGSGSTMSDRRAPHHSVQGDMIYSRNFIEFDAPGYPAYASSVHVGAVAGGCVQCHMDHTEEGIVEAGGHTFSMVAVSDETEGGENLNACTPCHAGIEKFDRTAYGDYDGDGNLEGTQTEVEGLIDVVLAAVDAAIAQAAIDDPDNYTIDCSAEGNGTHVAATVEDSHGRILLNTADGWHLGDCDHSGEIEGEEDNSRIPSGATGDLIWKAAFNTLKIEFDGSYGIHNASYAIQLLQRSYYGLTEEDVPGATIR